MKSILVLTTVPDDETAGEMAACLIEEHLAACVSISAPCVSVYRWQNKIEQSTEVQLIIKTTSDCYAKLQAAIVAMHPYELPEIIAIPIVDGLPKYLNWIDEETTCAA